MRQIFLPDCWKVQIEYVGEQIWDSLEVDAEWKVVFDMTGRCRRKFLNFEKICKSTKIILIWKNNGKKCKKFNIQEKFSNQNTLLAFEDKVTTLQRLGKKVSPYGEKRSFVTYGYLEITRHRWIRDQIDHRWVTDSSHISYIWVGG